MSGSAEGYPARAQEYAEVLGTIEAMASEDRRCIEAWAAEVTGPLLDAGCGPGHWTAHLQGRGLDAHGLDPVPEFLDIARRTHPDVSFTLGSFMDLARWPGRWGGILAWYSMIHLSPEEVPGVLEVLHGATRPQGTLLLGIFEGPRREIFDHAVEPAWFWPADEMAELLEQAGWSVLCLERRHDDGARPHAALHARKG